jgi:phosphohistidine phosphatase
VKIYLMRHGYAEADGGKPDNDRQLTPRGVELIEKTAAFLDRMHIMPAHVFCSPRTRAIQTANAVAAALGKQPEIREEVNFTFNTNTISDFINNYPDKDLMFVGHEPTIGVIIEAITKANVNVKPGSVACIEIRSETRLRGELLWFATPDIFLAVD